MLLGAAPFPTPFHLNRAPLAAAGEKRGAHRAGARRPPGSRTSTSANALRARLSASFLDSRRRRHYLHQEERLQIERCAMPRPGASTSSASAARWRWSARCSFKSERTPAPPPCYEAIDLSQRLSNSSLSVSPSNLNGGARMWRWACARRPMQVVGTRESDVGVSSNDSRNRRGGTRFDGMRSAPTAGRSCTRTARNPDAPHGFVSDRQGLRGVRIGARRRSERDQFIPDFFRTRRRVRRYENRQAALIVTAQNGDAFGPRRGGRGLFHVSNWLDLGARRGGLQCAQRHTREKPDGTSSHREEESRRGA